LRIIISLWKNKIRYGLYVGHHGHAFFSLSFVWFKVANASYGPLTIVLFRLIISALLLYPYARVAKRLVLPDKKDFGYLLLLAFCEPFLYFMGESYGLQYISPVVASVIIATIPLFAPVAAYLFYREKVSFQNVIGIGLSFIGVTLVIYQLGVGITASPHRSAAPSSVAVFFRRSGIPLFCTAFQIE
jgi:drug/metabolite transporter (DMT)-like permease